MDDYNDFTFYDLVKSIHRMPPELREEMIKDMESKDFDIRLDGDNKRDNDILKAKEALDRVVSEMPYVLKDKSIEVKDKARLMSLLASMQWAQSVMNDIRTTNTLNLGAYIRVAGILDEMDKTITYLMTKYPGKLG